MGEHKCNGCGFHFHPDDLTAFRPDAMGRCDVCHQECNPSVIAVGIGEFCMKHDPSRKPKATSEPESLRARVAELEMEAESVGAALAAVPHTCGSHRHIPCAGCEAAKIARSAAHVHDAAERSQHLVDLRARVADLETALATLLDAAERQAAGFPLEAEQWFAVRDFARSRLLEKSAEEVERG